MKTHELRNAGYRLTQDGCDAKCLNPQRKAAAIDSYAKQVRAHAELTATLTHLIVLNVLENA